MALGEDQIKDRLTNPLAVGGVLGIVGPDRSWPVWRLTRPGAGTTILRYANGHAFEDAFAFSRSKGALVL